MAHRSVFLKMRVVVPVHPEETKWNKLVRIDTHVRKTHPKNCYFQRLPKT